MYYESRAPGGADIQVESSHGMPDFRHCPCQKSAGSRAHVFCRNGVRTSILQDYIGIVVINHLQPGGNLMG